MPVLGPARCTSTMTSGISVMLASPRSSIISASPGPEVAVIARWPLNEAPMTMARAAISSSACTSVPPTLGSSPAKNSMIPVAGVMG